MQAQAGTMGKPRAHTSSGPHTAAEEMFLRATAGLQTATQCEAGAAVRSAASKLTYTDSSCVYSEVWNTAGVTSSSACVHGMESGRLGLDREGQAIWAGCWLPDPRVAHASKACLACQQRVYWPARQARISAATSTNVVPTLQRANLPHEAPCADCDLALGPRLGVVDGARHFW